MAVWVDGAAREEAEVTILLVQLPVAAVSIDETISPDRDDSLILEHLVRYCAKFDPLPAITIAIERDAARVIRGHKYLIVARMLGRATIRAVVASPPSSVDVKQFTARRDVTVLDWEAIKAKEGEDRNPSGWHVFFFERPLSIEEKRTFERATRELFADPTIDVLHDDSGPVAEFEARTPVTDTDWAARHLEVFRRYDREQVRIVSFQGRRFAQSDRDT